MRIFRYVFFALICIFMLCLSVTKAEGFNKNGGYIVEGVYGDIIEENDFDNDFGDDEETGSRVKYSDTVHVLVTEEQQAEIDLQLEKYEEEIIMIAKIIYREARSSKVPVERKAAVVWCILNRVDSNKFPNSIKAVIKQRRQFAWVSRTPVKKEFVELARDVLSRWLLEKEGFEDSGRTLPKEYLYFAANKGQNRFRIAYKGKSYWNWSLPDPYDLTS